jgi:hypothetical protein
MRKVYTLDSKGRKELTAGRPTLPAELGALLRHVDGRRTGYDVLAAAGKSAVKAGGLRWLKASGYILAVNDSGSARTAAPPAPSPSGALPKDDAGVCRMLSDFMLRSITLRLGKGGYEHWRRIERAGSVNELLPHLHPLTDAIAMRAGSAAGAEFADNAAFILGPLERGAVSG